MILRANLSPVVACFPTDAFSNQLPLSQESRGREPLGQLLGQAPPLPRPPRGHAETLWTGRDWLYSWFAETACRVCPPAS